MNIVEILEFIGSQGGMYRRKQIPEIVEYFKSMIEDGRVVAIYDNDKVVGIVAFSICDHYLRFYTKKCFDYLPHNPDGKTAYIEMAVASKWNKQIRKIFEYEISKKFPNFEYGIWYRSTKYDDRRVIARRKLCTQ